MNKQQVEKYIDEMRSMFKTKKKKFTITLGASVYANRQKHPMVALSDLVDESYEITINAETKKLSIKRRSDKEYAEYKRFMKDANKELNRLYKEIENETGKKQGKAKFKNTTLPKIEGKNEN